MRRVGGWDKALSPEGMSSQGRASKRIVVGVSGTLGWSNAPTSMASVGLLPGDNIEMEALFEEATRTLDLRTKEHEKLVATLALMRDQGKALFDDEDLTKVATLIDQSAATIDYNRAEVERIKAIYREEIQNVEADIREKQRVLDAIDNKLHTISDIPDLCNHFAAKQAANFQKLTRVKVTICTELRRSMETILAQMQPVDGIGNQTATGSGVMPVTYPGMLGGAEFGLAYQ